MADLDYVKVLGRLGTTKVDGPDSDTNPDTVWCDTGLVRFEPVVKNTKVEGGSPSPWLAEHFAVSAIVNSQGHLTVNGVVGVSLVDLGSDKVNPRVPRDKASYRVSFHDVMSNGRKVSFPSFTIHPEPGVINDLAALMPLPDVGGKSITRGLKGTSVTSLIIRAGNLIGLFSDGSETNAGPIPAAPGGSDAGVASYLSTNGTASRGVLLSAIDAKLDELEIPTMWVDASAAPYSADRTGSTDSRAAIQSAIDFVGANGGGTVFLPKGAYRINYTTNGAGTGCVGGLQLQNSVTLRGEGVATRLFTTGPWANEGGIVAIGDRTTTRNVRDAAVRELWIKGTSGTSHATSTANVNGILLNTNDITEEPDAAHRLLDLTVWDCDRGITVYGIDDRAVLGQRIRMRHFLRQALLIGKETGGGGADGYWSDIDASSGNRLPGGTYSTIEIRSSNVHMVNSKSWFTKRDTNFVNSGDYNDGAGFALFAPRTTMIGCEAQDNGGHGFLIRVGQQTLTGCVADSNNRSSNISGAALPYECSGFYIGSSASNVTLTSANSFDKRSDLSERFQRHGYAISSSARNIELRGLAMDNRSSNTSETPEDGVSWVGGSPHETHQVVVQSSYEGDRKTFIVGGTEPGKFVPIVDQRDVAQTARRIELDFPMATLNPNLTEVRDERDEIVSWGNEWGALRGRNPYSTWADSLVRGIIEAGDYVGTALSGGNFIEVVDRNLPDTPRRKLFGVRWGTGKIVRNGVEVPDLVVRQAASDPILESTPPNSVVVTLDGERGIGGVSEHEWSGGALPTVAGDVTVDPTSIVNSESLKIANTASAANARFEIVAASKVAMRFYIRTPSAWPSASVTIAGFRPTTSSLATSINLTGSGSPGRLRLSAPGGVTLEESPQNTLLVSTDYRVELRYDTTTKAAALAIYPMNENVAVWSSGRIVNDNFSLPIIRADIGRLNNTPVVNDFYLDGIQIVSGYAGAIGRHAGDTLSPSAVPSPPYAGAISFWDGTNLLPFVNH